MLTGLRVQIRTRFPSSLQNSSKTAKGIRENFTDTMNEVENAKAARGTRETSGEAIVDAKRRPAHVLIRLGLGPPCDGVKPSTPLPHALLLDSRRVQSSVLGGYRGYSNCGPLEGGDREEEANCVCQCRPRSTYTLEGTWLFSIH
jgi:hypothetical protein